MSRFVSLQRWIYASGDTVPNALRSLADELESLTENDIPSTEFIYDYSQDSIVEISYLDDADDDAYRAGICISWKGS